MRSAPMDYTGLANELKVRSSKRIVCLAFIFKTRAYTEFLNGEIFYSFILGFDIYPRESLI